MIKCHKEGGCRIQRSRVLEAIRLKSRCLLAMLSLKVLGKPTLSSLPVSGARGVSELMVAVTLTFVHLCFHGAFQSSLLFL